MIDELVGQRCMSIRRFKHQISEASSVGLGPIEFGWDDGTYLTLDANADWTLSLSRRPWRDPFADADESARRELAGVVGLWEEAPVTAEMGQVFGQVLTSAAPAFNEVGELSGLLLTFEDTAVACSTQSGDLKIEVLDL